MGEMTTQAPSVAGTMNLLTRLSRVTYRSATPELIGVKLKEFVALTYLRESTRATQQKLARDADARCEQLRDPAQRPRGRGPDREDPRSRGPPPAHRRDHPQGRTGRSRRRSTKLETVEDDVLGNLSQDERDQLRELLAKALEDHSLAI